MSVVAVERLRIRNPKIFKKCSKCFNKATDCGCRQGRNHESRRKGRISSQTMANHLRSGGAIDLKCPDCEGTEMDLDYTTGDTLCTFCGMVLECGGMLAYGWATFGNSSSKGYETLVYIREKLRSLHGTDPWIWDSEWDLILCQLREEYPGKEKEGYSIDYHRLNSCLGPKTFGDLCKRVRGPLGDYPLNKKKYGERWIQARKRLGLRVPEGMPQVGRKGGAA
jgi:hypothetical protein